MAFCWAGSWSKVAMWQGKIASAPHGRRNCTGIPAEETLDGLLGFETLETGPERARGRFEVRNQVKQPFGLVHGGVYAAFAESLASRATSVAVSADGNIAVGLSNHTSFLRPVSRAPCTPRRVARHRGRTTWLWDVRVHRRRGTALRPQPGDDGRAAAASPEGRRVPQSPVLRAHGGVRPLRGGPLLGHRRSALGERAPEPSVLRNGSGVHADRLGRLRSTGCLVASSTCAGVFAEPAVLAG